jgi:hypothetical protein
MKREIKFENDVEAANRLRRAVFDAFAIIRNCTISETCDSEVTNRRQCVLWSLIMFENEITEMCNQWGKELEQQKIKNQEQVASSNNAV